MPVIPSKKERKPGLTAETLTHAAAALAELDWRLLHWLLRYPLQRADDLAIGVARWASRATVYRHLQGLEASELVESVLPKTPGEGKRLYHLSNPGLHVLAASLERPARELARNWQADEAGLLRFLPRLPTLLPLQDVVNGLVTGAGEPMTKRGRRPQLVRWTWQRDVAHRFHYREQLMRFFADGAIALCVRAPQSDGSPRDEWYGLFLLCTELDDERLMRLRLERLLCWRESPERWPVYQHVLPVLLLARSPRQREHWQHAVDASTSKLCLAPLTGALACLSQQEGGPVNPWRLAWRALSTDVPCHLQDLLTPLPRAAFPLSVVGMGGEDDAPLASLRASASRTMGPTVISGRPGRLIAGDLEGRAARMGQHESQELENVALLGLRITQGQWRMLRLLLAHPLLSDEELAACLALGRKSVRCALYDLAALACLEPVATSAGKRWRLRERALLLLASANHLSIWSIAQRPDAGGTEKKGTPVLVQRGESWLLQRIAHTAGIYGFSAALAAAARQVPEQALCWWETGAACERRYCVGEQWYNLRPDALAEYRAGTRRQRFWLEWDRGTMNVRDLTVKFTSYAHYLASREWAREGAIPPSLLCVAPELAQERRIQRVAQTSLSPITRLVVWTTTAVLLREYGPLAPIWSPGAPPSGQVAKAGGPPRRCLFQTISREQGK